MRLLMISYSKAQTFGHDIISLRGESRALCNGVVIIPFNPSLSLSPSFQDDVWLIIRDYDLLSTTTHEHIHQQIKNCICVYILITHALVHQIQTKYIYHSEHEVQVMG